MRSSPWAALVVMGAGFGCAGSSEYAQTEARAESLMRDASARRGDLELRCEPEDAEVILDGVPQGLCSDFIGDPHWLTVGDGMHHVVVRKPGYAPYETYYQPSGARAVLRIQLRPLGQKASEGVSP